MSVDLYDPSAPTATSDVDLVSAVTSAGNNDGCAINAVDTHIESSCTQDVIVGDTTMLVSASGPVTTNYPTSLELAYAVSSRDGDPLHDGSNNNCSILSQCSQGLLEHSVLMVSEEPMTSNTVLAMGVGIAAASSHPASSHPFLPSQSGPKVKLDVEESDIANAQCPRQDAGPATPLNGQLNVLSASADERRKNSPDSKKESGHVPSNSRSQQGSGSPRDGREENEKPSRHNDEYGRKSRERYTAHRKPYAREERRTLDHEHRLRTGNEEKKPDYDEKKRADREDRRASDRDDRKRIDIQDRRHADYGTRRRADYEDKKPPDHDNRKHADYEERRRASEDDRRKVEREGQRHRDLPDRRQLTQDNHRRFGHEDRRSPRYNNDRSGDRDSYRYQGRSDGRCRAETSDVEDKLSGTSKHAAEKSSKTFRRGRSRSRSITPRQQPRPSMQQRGSDSRTEIPPVRRPTNSDVHARSSPVYDNIVKRKSSSPVKNSRRSRESPGAKLSSRQTSVDTIVTESQSSGIQPQPVPLDQTDVGSNQESGSDVLPGEARSLRRLDTSRSPLTTQGMQQPLHSASVSVDDKRDSMANGGSSEHRIVGGRPQPSASPAQQGFQAVWSAESSRSRLSADTVSSISFTELMRLPPPPLPPPTLIMPLPSSGPPLMSGIPPARMPPLAPSLLPQSLPLQFPPAHHTLLAHHGMPPPPLGLLPPVSVGLLPPPLSHPQSPHGARPPRGMQPFVPTSTSSPGLFLSPPPSGLQSYMPHPTGHLPFMQLSRPPPFVSPPTGPLQTEQPPPPPPPASHGVHGIDRLVGIHGGSAGAHFQRHPEPGFATSASPPPPPDFFTGSEKTDEALKARSNLIVIQPSDAGSQTHQEPFRVDPSNKYSSSDDMTEAPMDMAADGDSDEQDDVSCGTPGGGNAAKDLVDGEDSLHKYEPPSEGVNAVITTAGRAAPTTASEEHRNDVVHLGQGDAAAPPHGSADTTQPPQRAIEVLQQLQQLLSRGGASQQGHEPQVKSEMHTGVLGAVLSGKASSNEVAGGVSLKKTKKARSASRAEILKVKESPGSDIPSSATELSNLKAIEKMNRQERIAEEVKVVLKPYYRSGKVSKAEYKEIMKKAVHKIYNSKSAEINPVKVKVFVDGYVAKTIQVHKLQRRRQQVQS